MLHPSDGQPPLDFSIEDSFYDAQFVSFIDSLGADVADPATSPIGVAVASQSDCVSQPVQHHSTRPSRSRGTCSQDGSPKSDSSTDVHATRAYSAQQEVCLVELPTAEEAKRQKIRAKNRRNQKAYRDRLKV